MIESCAKCPHLGGSLFRNLNDEGLEIARGLLRPYTVEGRGKAIFNQGQPITGLYFVCTGVVKLTKLLERGDEIILDVLSPCSVMGELPHSALGKEQRHGYSAVSLSNTVEVRLLRVADYRSLPNLLPDFQRQFTEHCCERLSRAYKNLEMMQLPVEERLMAKLLHLLPSLSSKTSVPLSFAELAQFVQTTPETISRTIRRLISKGRVQILEGKLFLKNPSDPPHNKRQ